MQFSSIRVAGFKSFVEASELRIEPGLTGVVGPNGCGKSNILEALRWVMGESSPKSLRGGGMEDVIFAGTALRPGRQFAEVRLTLDNRQRAAPGLWNAEPVIEVVRRIERRLGSAYRINGRDVRQRDVQLLFADAGSGAHSPALVSQGRIGAIVNARPSERRLLLEEAAGIAGLNVRRGEAEIRLRATSANLARLDELSAQMESQASALRRAARQAERYTALNDRIQNAEAMLLFGRWRAAAAAAQHAGECLETAEAAAATAIQLAAAATRQAAQAQAGLPALRDGERAAAERLVAAQAAREALARELAASERRLRDLSEAEAACARDMAREGALASDADATLARLDAEATTLRDRELAARENLPGCEAAVVAAERDVAASENGLARAMEAQARAQAQLRAAEGARAAASARFARSEAERGKLVDELARIDDASQQDEVLAARGEVVASLGRLDEAAAALVAAEARRSAAAAGRDAAGTALGAARATVAGLSAERDAVARLLAGPARSAAGAAGEAITVEPGFEAAVAAALGSDLDAPLGEAGWAGACGDDDPPLPTGARPLSEVVSAPPALTRRLAQTGIVEDGTAFTLAPGQRLVSAAGRLWRWDGFRAAPASAGPTAERLVQRNRLKALEAELVPARATLALAEQSARAANDAAAAAAGDEIAKRSRRAVLERDHAAAAAKLAHAEAIAERRAGRRADLLDGLARLDAELASHSAELAVSKAALVEAGDPSGLARALTTARAAAEAARQILARARASFDSLQRESAAAAGRLQTLEAEQAGWCRRAAAAAEQCKMLAGRHASLVAERQMLATQPAALAAAAAALADDIAAADAARRSAGDALVTAEATVAALDAAARVAEEQVTIARERRARAAADAEHAAGHVAAAAALATERFAIEAPALAERFGLTADEADDAPLLARRLEALKAERERMGPVNLRAAIELAEIESGLKSSGAERAELDIAVAKLRGSIGALNREGRQRLLGAFEAVDGHFRELFGTLFAGGEARLELVDAEDPLEAGLEIMAQPPGKALTSLSLLSGGEQALTAVALIFALFLTNPAPVCVLDEVDAPLDDANVERFCDLLDRVSAATGTRFLIVTHNAVTMSRMHRLFGVTMAEPGVSQLVSVDLARAEAMLLAAE